MVPKGWEKNSLDSLFEFKNGLNTEKEQYGNGYKFVNVMDVFRNDILTESKIIGRVQVTDKQLEGYQLKYGDVLFNRTSETFDEIAIAAIYLDNAIATFGGFVIRARPKGNQIDPAYSVFLFQSKSYRSQVVKLGQGAIRANIGQKDLARVCILVPPLAEQKKIAQILSTWDKAISVTEKLLTNSQQQKKALMQQLLTGKKRLLDENGVRFSGEWEKGKFCDMANIDTGYAFKSKDFTQSDSGIPIIRMSDFKTGGLDVLGAAKVDRDSVNGLDKFKLRVGDFVFGMSGSLNNYGRVEKKDLPCYLNQRVGRILAKECANQAFITYLYLSDSIQQSILNKAAGAAQLNISISDLRSMVVYYPCIEEQQKIAAVLSAADAEISTLEKKLACLRDEKKALMQQLLTGKRRVKVDEAVAE
ncbi:restriction endonuclease subunit S [Escherichia coli]|nr:MULTISPECIES: restriction endonuclease subunit S [Escherichia]MBW8480208.1 restriction endonuclease subunit S [Escherichia coli]MBW8533539.1 restriction endonuclease subunit S [Escherichia coli]MBW8581773.1 restriction endonuclease subunit S [Escherichia coli]MBW8589934.1 restriction endonuclease subunit S [Escherichia coli]MBW8599035.1 restriction endonuclease subunit S [Escherichia coli]